MTAEIQYPFKINSNQICKGWVFFEIQELWGKLGMLRNIEIWEVDREGKYEHYKKPMDQYFINT